MHEEQPSSYILEPDVDGVLKFLHYRDPQNENQETAAELVKFLVAHKDELAAGGDNILNELYEKFKARQS
jgi:hypothetical protein